MAALVGDPCPFDGESSALDEALGDDLRHELIGVVDALAPLKAQRERKGGGEVARVGRRQLFNGVGMPRR